VLRDRKIASLAGLGQEASAISAARTLRQVSEMQGFATVRFAVEALQSQYVQLSALAVRTSPAGSRDASHAAPLQWVASASQVSLLPSSQYTCSHPLGKGTDGSQGKAIATPVIAALSAPRTCNILSWTSTSHRNPRVQ
jgi:hypothetical protein